MASKIAKICLALFATSMLIMAVPECKDLDESVANFDSSQCKKYCKEKKDTDKFDYSESEKGGAFAYKCDCDGKEYCKDVKYDPDAANDAVSFYTISPLVATAGLLLGVRNL